MTRTIGAVLGGAPGSGKTVTMVAFMTTKAIDSQQKVDGQTKRLIIDMEARAHAYRAQDYGLETDDPAKLLFAFDVYPEVDVITADQFVFLFESIKAGRVKPDMIGIDNIVLFQDEISGWCQEKSIAASLVEAAGIKHKFRMFLDYNWKVGEPNWYRLMKSVLKEFLMELRRKGINFVGTTELKNVWQNYGKKGYDTDGQPFQRIVGKSASLWDPWLQICDTVWNLTRKTQANKLQARPTIELDRFVPKCSIVGVPPQFVFASWLDIWAMESARLIPTNEQLDKLDAPQVEYPDALVTEQTEGAVGQTVEVNPTTWIDVLRRANDHGRQVWLKARELQKQKMDPARAWAELSKNGVKEGA